MPGGDRLIHGDFHPYNVLGNPDAAVIIDWVDAANGPPQADVCRSYVLMLARVAALAEAYVERYCAVAGWHRNEVEQWLPFVAAGRLCENITDDEAVMLRDLAA